MTEQQKDILRKHYHLWRIVNNDRALSGAAAEQQELADLHKAIGKGTVNVKCGTCLMNMWEELYVPFELPDGTSELFFDWVNGTSVERTNEKSAI